LPRVCSFFLLSVLQDAAVLTGVLQQENRGRACNGIQAKQLFLWLPVTGIHVDPESPAYIYFEVGALSKKLSIALFDAPPTCHERTSSESTRVTDFFDSTVKVRFFKIHTLMCNVFA
jgi:hypothetical protein